MDAGKGSCFMDRIVLHGAVVHLDFALVSRGSNGCGIISYFDRSLSAVRSFGASLNFRDKIRTGSLFLDFDGTEYETFVQPIAFGKEKFYHGLSISKNCGKRFFVFHESARGRMFYDYLMANYDLPLLDWWGDVLYQHFKDCEMIEERTCLACGDYHNAQTLSLGQETIEIEDLRIAEVFLDDETLREAVSYLLQEKKIFISERPQVHLEFGNMDEYFKNYGPTLVRNLEKTIEPLCELDGEAHDFTLNGLRLYPQQIAQVNGDVALLEHGKYAILNHGMGTGKTVSAPSVCESFFVRKWLRTHPKKTLADAYASPENIKYRNIVMCPGHLVEKWASEIREQVPYARVTVIREFSQLLDLRERGAKRTGKEYYILSKDFCKLSYQSIPTPTKVRSGMLKNKVCSSCGKEFYEPGPTCPYCGNTGFKKETSPVRMHGMACPHCNNVLIPYAKRSAAYEEGSALTPMDFEVQSQKNSRCYYCGEELWKPFVASIGGKTERKWVRATYYANRAKKGTKTIWVYKDAMDSTNALMGQPLNVLEEREGARKYAPAEFIKRYMKGYFDIAIFDEIQDLKGGFTGQGHAMHALIKASKKQLCLTGTIAGGVASDLFYTLFRLEPKRMIERGFKYSDELAFSQAYGKVEKTFDYSPTSDGAYLASCKGRQKGQAKVKPGISPVIFMDFLLDRTTFLDLSDMSKYLPKFKEIVLSTEPDERERDMFQSYRKVIDALVKASKDKASGGMGLLSNMLQFSLSYLDKPYGVSPILSPVDGSVVCKPENFDFFKDTDVYENLLSKERGLVDLINKEQSEGRNCVVYCEYTGKEESCVTGRLKAIIERHCNLKGKVAVLESSSPKASEREAWMHKKAKEGVKVFITNPRCVSTGLDFCFTEEGVHYNYPTLIFDQLGYSLFVVWQASRRAYRLNQTKECRCYYSAWRGSAQEAVISLIAEKQAATSAIQGKFSTEGLAAMANGVDSRMKLAQAMSNMDEITGNGLQEMFDVLATDEENESYGDYKPMLLFKELIGEEVAPMGSFDTVKTGQFSVFDEAFLERTKQEDVSDTGDGQKKEPAASGSAVAEIVSSTVSTSVKPLVLLTVKQKKRNVVSGQFSLF